jgi:hypothetical protein
MKIKSPRSLLLAFAVALGAVVLGPVSPASAADGCTSTPKYSNSQHSLTISCTNVSGTYSYQPSLKCGSGGTRFYGNRILLGSSTANCPAGYAYVGSPWIGASLTTNVSASSIPSGSCPVEWTRSQYSLSPDPPVVILEGLVTPW